ncbi:MAG TPA: pseudouridine synthase, partial [Ferruginibacter sp.]|nr:pseudouridine synthase [Ferruginibacter sp.]
MKKLLLDIVFENQSFVAINKPAGLLSIPDREQSQVSLKEMLTQKYGSIFTVHRLDKDTSGLIIFAKTESSHKYLSKLFEGRQIEKYYQGLVHGIPSPPKGTI